MSGEIVTKLRFPQDGQDDIPIGKNGTGKYLNDILYELKQSDTDVSLLPLEYENGVLTVQTDDQQLLEDEIDKYKTMIKNIDSVSKEDPTIEESDNEEPPVEELKDEGEALAEKVSADTDFQEPEEDATDFEKEIHDSGLVDSMIENHDKLKSIAPNDPGIQIDIQKMILDNIKRKSDTTREGTIDAIRKKLCEEKAM